MSQPTTPPPGTTNAQFPFQPGEVIDWCGSKHIVLENYGDSGRVREQGNATEPEEYLYSWDFGGEVCSRTGEVVTL